jgi:hypothetical protein
MFWTLEGSASIWFLMGMERSREKTDPGGAKYSIGLKGIYRMLQDLKVSMKIDCDRSIQSLGINYFVMLN